MKKEERDQIAQILLNYVTREYHYSDPQRKFQEYLIESWHKTGYAGTGGTLDRDAFAELMQAAAES